MGFKADGFQQRLLDVMADWSIDVKNDASSQDPVPSVQSLEGLHDLDYAVARGGCYYGWNKQSGGLRIRGGTANSYYVGIETAGLAIPGAPRPLKALCVVPFGMEEGTITHVPSDGIGLVVGQPVSFHFFRSNTRKDDQPGLVLEQWSDEELTETDPLSTTLTREGSDETHVPIKFDAAITELGMFELWCVEPTTDNPESSTEAGQWKLEFSVRDE